MRALSGRTVVWNATAWCRWAPCLRKLQCCIEIDRTNWVHQGSTAKGSNFCSEGLIQDFHDAQSGPAFIHRKEPSDAAEHFTDRALLLLSLIIICGPRLGYIEHAHHERYRTQRPLSFSPCQSTQTRPLAKSKSHSWRLRRMLTTKKGLYRR